AGASVPSQRRRPPGGGVLGVVGLTEKEEETYRCLVGRTGLTAETIGLEIGRTTDQVDRALDTLVAMGLAVADPHSGSVSAAPPAIALGALLRQRRDDLNSAER